MTPDTKLSERERIARIIDPAEAVWEGFAIDTSRRGRALEKADAIIALQPEASAAKDAEIERLKRRGDNHWETLRSIREMAREGDCERIVLWVNDAGSGSAESVEKTMKTLSDERNTAEAQNAVLTERVRELEGELNAPELHDFAKGAVLEAAHQRARWGSDHDAGKAPEDWFWLIGYLAGKALASHRSGNTEKALHHTISSAAALANWHAAITGAHTTMRPGIDPAVLLNSPEPKS